MARQPTRWAEPLEPRLLHSADLAPLLAGAALPDAEHHALLAADDRRAETEPAAELVFVDATLADADTLLADLRAQQGGGRALEIVLLQAGDDGVAVIGAALAGRAGAHVGAIHILTHGAAGALQLGGARLDADALLLRAAEIGAWRGALAPGADLLLYGCDVAAGSAGAGFVADLAALTGADVAASTDLTGAAAAGGDWVLEAATGRIDAALAPGLAAQQAFAGTLAVHMEKVESAKSSGSTTTLRWEHDVNPNDRRLLVVQLVVGTQLGSLSVSYGGQAMTLLASQDALLLVGGLRTEVWYLVAPESGKADVVVSSSVSTRMVGGSMDFKNVDPSAPFGPVVRVNGSSSNVSLTVAASSNDIVIDVVGSKGVEEGSYGSRQNKTWEQSQGEDGSDVWGSASREDGAASVTMSQTLEWESSARWAAIAVAVKQNGTNTAPVITSHGGGATAALAVPENGTRVADIDASDAESATLTYTIAGGTDAARFTIDASSGELRFVAAPDTEAPNDADANGVYQVTVRVSDGVLSDTQALTITVTDANEFAVGAVVDTDAAAQQVTEGAAIGAAVGITAHATDADATTDTITYSLVDNAGGRFAIDAVTGVVRVAAALDRETAASHGLVVRATSADGSSTTRAFTVAVLDADEFDTGPVTDTDADPETVHETAWIGTSVGITAHASDADAETSAITYSLDDDAGGRFAIDGASGVVSVAGALDRETAASHVIVVRATSADGSAATQSFTIAVSDDNELGVGTVSDSDAGVDGVAENLAAGAATGVSAHASDPDGGDTIAYALVDDAGGRFTIDAATGVVRTAAALDAEAAAGWTIVVRATSTDTSSTEQAFTIAVHDVDEADVTAPADTDAGADAVDENAAVGSAVGITASATDADATTHGVAYSLLDDAGGRFGIDAATGVVRVAGALDREAAASHTIVVRATSADGSTAQTSFTIAVRDVNEFFVGAPADTDAAADAVGENAAVGSSVGITARAVDGDGHAVSYSLLDTAGGRFSIDAATGVVRVAGALDREAAASHTIVVQAQSSDGSSAQSAFTIGIGDVDEFDVGALVDGDAAADAIDETAPDGTPVGIRVSAVDADASTNAVTYTLLDDAGGRFVIDAVTGVVYGTGATDRETAASHTIVVQATSADGSTAPTSFTIGVRDVDEFVVTAPTDADAGADAVDENAAIGSTVGITAWAVDADATHNAVAYSLLDSAGGRFGIDATSGVVRVAGALDRETAASHTIVVQAMSADGRTAQTSFTIGVGEVDDLAIGALSDADAAPDAVDETAAAGTAVGIRARVANPDGTTATVAYSLPDDAGGRFAIDRVSGVVRIVGGLDFETAADHRITIQATAANGSSTRHDAVVAVRPTNDNAPVIGSPADFAVAKNTLAVGVLQATDADLPPGALAWRITGGADAALFTIDAATGALRFVQAPGHDQPGDADRDQRYQLTVAVGDGDHQTAQALTVTLLDVDEAPRLRSHGGAATVALSVGEGHASATPVTAIAAVDPEGRAIGYRISGGADAARFTIDAVSGVLRFVAAPDFEHAADAGADNVYDVTVAAGDGTHETLQALAITVGDRNDAPQAALALTDAATRQDAAFSLALPAGAFADADAGDMLRWSATLASGAALPSWLSFDAASRTFAGRPGNAEVGTLQLAVQVSDRVGASATQTFALRIDHVNHAPQAETALHEQTARAGEAFRWDLPAGSFSDPDTDDTLRHVATLASGEALPAWLRFDARTLTFSGTPLAGDQGVLVVRITAIDADGASAHGDLRLAVTAAPVTLPPELPATALQPPAAEPDAEPTAAPAPADEPAPAEPAAAAFAPPAGSADDALAAPPPPPMTAVDAPRASAGADAGPALSTPHRAPAGGGDAVLAAALVPQFAALGDAATAAGWLAHGGELQRTHEALQQQLLEAAEQRRAALAGSAVISGGLSIGYVVWLVRGGVLMSSMLSTLPAWKMLDPLPVLAAAGAGGRRRAERDGSDDIERLFDGKQRRRRPAPAASAPASAAENKVEQELSP